MLEEEGRGRERPQRIDTYRGKRRVTFDEGTQNQRQIWDRTNSKTERTTTVPLLFLLVLSEIYERLIVHFCSCLNSRSY